MRPAPGVSAGRGRGEAGQDPASAPGPMRRGGARTWRPALAATAALALAIAGCREAGKTAHAPSPAPPFDASAAFELLKQQVAFGPRVPGTPGHQRQLDWMVAYLKQRADTVIVQPFTAVTPKGDTLHLSNVIARFKPAATDRVLLLAHWDTRQIADSEADSAKKNNPIPGANDGASGVAVLMQLADVLKRHSPPVGVDLLFDDGEDYAGNMYAGSQYFAATWGPTYHPLYGILLDMVGDQNPQFPIEPNSQDAAPEIVDRVWSAAERIGLGTDFPRSPGEAIEDDHIPLLKAGIHTVDIIDFDYQGQGCTGVGAGGPCWHTLQDTVAHTSPLGLGVVGRVVADLIYSGG